MKNPQRIRWASAAMHLCPNLQVNSAAFLGDSDNKRPTARYFSGPEHPLGAPVVKCFSKVLKPTYYCASIHSINEECVTIATYVATDL